MSDIETYYEMHKYPIEKFNIFGIRRAGGFTNTFNDHVGVYYETSNGVWVSAMFAATTDPGLFWLENPSNVNGTAILKPGNYKNSHKIGLHKGEYKALVQNTPLPVWRDKDKDHEYDYVSIDNGMFGINIHRANPSTTSKQVDKWSAGCQVLANPDDFNTLLTLAEQHGTVFTYTLFDE